MADRALPSSPAGPCFTRCIYISVARPEIPDEHLDVYSDDHMLPGNVPTLLTLLFVPNTLPPSRVRRMVTCTGREGVELDKIKQSQ